jgi:hypothetical protein
MPAKSSGVLSSALVEYKYMYMYSYVRVRVFFSPTFMYVLVLACNLLSTVLLQEVEYYSRYIVELASEAQAATIVCSPCSDFWFWLLA